MNAHINENPWRKDFPILNEKIYNQPLVYLDNAATSQMPRQVIDRISEYYTKEHSNIHRGLHYLSAHATDVVEQARERIAGFIQLCAMAAILFPDKC